MGWGWGKTMSLALVLLNLWSPWVLSLAVGVGAWRDAGWIWDLPGLGGARRALRSIPFWGQEENPCFVWLVVLREALS